MQSVRGVDTIGNCRRVVEDLSRLRPVAPVPSCPLPAGGTFGTGYQRRSTTSRAKSAIVGRSITAGAVEDMSRRLPSRVDHRGNHRQVIGVRVRGP
jgi:hypothetical protein